MPTKRGANTCPNWAADLWRKADKSGGELACWNWTASFRGSKRSGNYGKHHDALGRAQYAHRLAYHLVHGRIPRDLVVMHRCDNPSCINPAHLTLGTVRENTWDAIEKGRFRWTKAHCRNGHEGTPENTGWKKNGRRFCRRCQAEAQQRWILKQQQRHTATATAA